MQAALFAFGSGFEVSLLGLVGFVCSVRLGANGTRWLQGCWAVWVGQVARAKFPSFHIVNQKQPREVLCFFFSNV